MAYTFTDISGDRIYPGAVTNAGTFSFFARFNLKSDTGGGGANRWVASINDTTAANYQLVLYFPFGSTNRLQFGFTESGVAKLAVWDTGWTTPFEAAVVGTYDGSDLNVYSAGSSTPVATLATSATPDQGSQQMGLGCVFIDPPPTVFTAPIILYEAGWYPGVVLTAVGEGVEHLPEGDPADLAGDVPDEAHATVVVEPVGEVMEAGRVAVAAAAAVTDPLQGREIVGEAGLPRPDQARQDDGVFHEGYAVEAAQIDDELLRPFTLERFRLVRGAEEPVCRLGDEVGKGLCAVAPLPCRAEERLADFTVFGQMDHGSLFLAWNLHPGLNYIPQNTLRGYRAKRGG